jgi:hypothetical protein
MATSDLLHNGRLASWEFVRLLSHQNDQADLDLENAKPNY